MRSISRVTALVAGLGAEAVGNTPEQFLGYIRSEIPKYAKVIRESGARVD
jgi:hypothetical protein